MIQFPQYPTSRLFFQRKLFFLLCALVLTMTIVAAQPVTYSPYIRDYSYPSLQIAGKAGNNYWLQKSKGDNRPRFDVFDYRMNLLAEVAGDPLADHTIKEYLVGGPSHFDQLQIATENQQTVLLLKRYSADGQYEFPRQRIDSFSFGKDAGGFLLLQSPNRQRVELLVFESRGDLTQRLHMLLFDADWHLLNRSVVVDPSINVPCIQDEFISSPIADFDNLPVKLTNTGDCFLSTSSNTNHNYLLFHFTPGAQYTSHEIRLPPLYSVDDISLNLDNRQEGASVAVLSNFRHTSLKQLQVIHYSTRSQRIDFDSAYFFNTVSGGIQHKNLVRESLAGLPGGGYLFCLENGISSTSVSEVPATDYWDAAFLLAGMVSGAAQLPSSTQSDFVRVPGLHAPQTDIRRGDLSMYYFPSGNSDSTWTAIIRAPQTTSMNWPALSYLLMPEEHKLLFIYNSFINEVNFAGSTVLDRRGNPIDGSLLFWKFSRALNFQHAQRIDAQEVAVPYLEQRGFAVIRL